MATQADARRIALALPETVEASDRFAISVRDGAKLKGFIWVWRERLEPKKARTPNPKVLAVRVASLVEKDMMISAEPTKFFTEPHYNGYPAVLVHLAKVKVPELRELINDAWRCQAPKKLKTAQELSTKRSR